MFGDSSELGAPAASCQLVVIDWGTSSLRAYLVNTVGRIVQRRESQRGLATIAVGGFEQAMRESISDWMGNGTHIIAAGMVTSRRGWIETPYCDCPCSLSELATKMETIELAGGVDVSFVPGLRTADPPFDVIRGEEVQLLGVGGSGVVVLPGTHSKWVRLQADSVVDFSTFVTGELRNLILDYSVIGQFAQGREECDASFAEGLHWGRDCHKRGGVARAVFAARTMPLIGRIAPRNVASYLSGILIGAEIAEAVSFLGSGDSTFRIVGSEKLAELYKRGFSEMGLTATCHDPDAAAIGMIRLAQTRGWLA